MVAVMPGLARCERLLEIIACKIVGLGAESATALVIVIGRLREMMRERWRETFSSIDENVKLVLSVIL